MPFRDRIDAGRRLAQALLPYREKDTVILALPRGGVEVGAEIAHALNAPLDLLMVRKIGAPMHSELAVGAVIDGGSPIVVRNEEVIRLSHTSEAEFQAICRRELAEIERRVKHYLGGRPALDTQGKIAIVVDDGIATGATMRAALRALRQRKPAKLVLAVPVAPPDAIAALRSEVDEVVCLETPDDFGALGYFYEDFHQLTDADVIAILDDLAPAALTGPANGGEHGR